MSTTTPRLPAGQGYDSEEGILPLNREHPDREHPDRKRIYNVRTDNPFDRIKDRRDPKALLNVFLKSYQREDLPKQMLVDLAVYYIQLQSAQYQMASYPSTSQDNVAPSDSTSRARNKEAIERAETRQMAIYNQELVNGWRYRMDDIIAQAKKDEVAERVREAEIALQTADRTKDTTEVEAMLAEAKEWAAELGEEETGPAGAKRLRRSE